jgi:hypothetical protein
MEFLGGLFMILYLQHGTPGVEPLQGTLEPKPFERHRSNTNQIKHNH